MAKAFVSAGSNIDPETNMREAVRILASETRITAISTVYLTEPIGRPDQPFYYNSVIGLETSLSPLELKNGILRKIEQRLGRTRSIDKFGPRTIDLDLILYGDLVMTGEELTLPAAEILERPFLTMAVYELAPDLVLPGTGVLIAKAAGELQQHMLKRLQSYTDILRKELRYGFEQGKDTESHP